MRPIGAVGTTTSGRHIRDYETPIAASIPLEMESPRIYILRRIPDDSISGLYGKSAAHPDG